MYGIYVQSTRAIDYATSLVKGYKRIETRTRDVFKNMDKREPVAIIRTGRGRKPEIVGFVLLMPGYHCPAERFQDFNSYHLVPPGSKYDTDERGKWFYEVYDPVALETPIELPKEHINHGRSYTEFTL